MQTANKCDAFITSMTGWKGQGCCVLTPPWWHLRVTHLFLSAPHLIPRLFLEVSSLSTNKQTQPSPGHRLRWGRVLRDNAGKGNENTRYFRFIGGANPAASPRYFWWVNEGCLTLGTVWFCWPGVEWMCWNLSEQESGLELLGIVRTPKAAALWKKPSALWSQKPSWISTFPAGTTQDFLNK